VADTVTADPPGVIVPLTSAGTVCSVRVMLPVALFTGSTKIVWVSAESRVCVSRYPLISMQPVLRTVTSGRRTLTVRSQPTSGPPGPPLPTNETRWPGAPSKSINPIFVAVDTVTVVGVPQAMRPDMATSIAE
jgi:hypothetical protein